MDHWAHDLGRRPPPPDSYRHCRSNPCGNWRHQLFSSHKESFLVPAPTPEQADAALNLHHDNPHRAVAHPDAPDPMADIAELIAYLANPQTATAYLHRLDRLKDNQSNDYLQNQLHALIAYRQLDTHGQTWHNRLRQHDADLQGLDLNRLHTLYARLSELRRPDRQQIGQTLNIKALLLETCDKRNLEL